MRASFQKSHNLPGGFGTALKPASEHWWLARKRPIGTVAQNVTRYGTGALNIDGARIKYQSEADRKANDVAEPGMRDSRSGFGGGYRAPTLEAGRWPSNVLLSSPELFDEPNPGVVGSGATEVGGGFGVRGASNHTYGGGKGFTDATGETVGYGDSGGYSRFFIIPKADRAERERGLRPTSKLKLRDDLSDEQRAFVESELQAAGVPT